MNNYQRMRVTNAKIKEELKKREFYDIKLFPHSRFFKDIYGCDGVAKKNGKIVWLQFKTGYASKEDKTLMAAFSMDYDQSVLLAEYVNKGKTKIVKITEWK